MNDLLRASFKAHALLPAYQRRIQQAQTWIAEALEICRRPYIAFSTGKDSTVMADLVWRQNPDVPAVYFDADAAFPESREMLERYRAAGRIIINWRTEPLLETMARAGGPLFSENATMESTVYAPIRALVAEYGFDGAFVGLRAEESLHRNLSITTRGTLFLSQRHGIYSAWPIAKLTFRDVWAYILSWNVDYNAVYDRQFAMGLPWENCRVSYCYGETVASQGRWIVLARGWPELFNRFAQAFPEVRRFI
jgi:3'-phosphoadenosine 5'-phosphosulfate sulfotransferase (PAPS reductase)/FAD synthetase